jgi:hypothetical protein
LLDDNIRGLHLAILLPVKKVDERSFLHGIVLLLLDHDTVNEK